MSFFQPCQDIVRTVVAVPECSATPHLNWAKTKQSKTSLIEDFSLASGIYESRFFSSLERWTRV